MKKALALIGLSILFSACEFGQPEKQKVEIEQQFETLRTTYFKIIGAIDALSQIEESNLSESEEESEEE